MLHSRTAVLAVAVLLASCSVQRERPADEDRVPVAAPEPAPVAHAVTVAAVGDIMMGTDYPRNILPDDDGAGFLRDVTPMLSAADVAFGNLEGVLMDGGEAVKQCEPAVPASSQPDPPAMLPTGGTCYVFRTPPSYVTYLRAAGFDVLSLANNHAQDFGDAGRAATMRALDAAGIRHSGRDGDVARWTVKGLRLALVAFAPNVGAHQLNDLGRAQGIVSRLAAQYDIVIVSFHGGGEGEAAAKLPFARETYHNEDRGDVVQFAHAVIDAGADLVLGHGPHVLRAIELYRDRLIAYSLGNFATYYGISVSGIRGIAAVLEARMDNEGRFLEGRIEPTVQIRPAGPLPDPERRAVMQIRDLTNEAFPQGRLSIADDGRITRHP